MIKRNLPLLANVASAFLFGFAYYFIKMGMEVVNQDTVKFLAFRFTLGFLVMTLLVVTGVRKVNYHKGAISMILVCGLCNPLISQVLETTSTTYAPTSTISLYNSLMPIVMIALSALINREYPTRRQLCFVGVTALGLLIINATAGAGSKVSGLGYTLIFSSMLAIALGRVLVRRASGVFSSFEIIYVTTAMGALAFTVTALVRHLRYAPLGAFFEGLLVPRFVIAVAYMGIGSCVAAFLLMTYASANLPFAVFASTSTLSNIVGILSGVFLLHEAVSAQDMIGMAVVLTGIIGISLSYNRADTEGNRFQKRRKGKDISC
ncbi:MAG: DMT family transporter [Clostridiales bacterium]|nr:DMT family transporter [Clostridiales bacterium]